MITRCYIAIACEITMLSAEKAQKTFFHIGKIFEKTFVPTNFFTKKIIFFSSGSFCFEALSRA
jgi:hypothetical protein